MTSANPTGFIECIASGAESAARDGDHQTHGALHVVETKLRELRVSCLEAEKVVRGDERLMLLRRIRAKLVAGGTPECRELLGKLEPELYPDEGCEAL